ncbi:sulfatase family protein [Pontiella sulfatireligans]|uniref:Arylsulfatase n=1 Tax=Pontiella sulfatireligans TaxID=2750658 RepID=A0A6C2UD57_9BACT|nr:arylsulfatase [Pontiella sulfatireligans]SPS74126.1 sulfatase S1_15 [Kiritimatiellales bacterium]VGO18080.1 Arylsulfatase [Pontiella sulfatireligans]
MNRNKLLVFILMGCVLSGICLKSIAAERPNIVYILADDMGIGDVSTYNPEGKIPTPNIDGMARAGMKFMDAHTGSSVCTPTRYGIMTGRYAWRTHLKQGVLNSYSAPLIDPSRETVASFLKKQGYKTACIGKWHLGIQWTSKEGPGGRTGGKYTDFSKPLISGPQDVGFDDYFGIAASLDMNPYAFIDGRFVQGELVLTESHEELKQLGLVPVRPGWVAKGFAQDEVLSTITHKTCDWIRQNANQPFFVYMPLNSPHGPIVPRDEFKGKSGLNPHGDFCMETDWAVGEVLKTLAELGIADNTMVVFTTDNGTSPGAKVKDMQAKGHYSSWIYRGLKGTIWEGGHRVPFVVQWPNEVKAGVVETQAICLTDLLATCADLSDRKLPDQAGEDSVSFLPALKGQAIPGQNDRMIVHHSDKGFFAVRRGKWKLMLDNKGGSRRQNPKEKNNPVINSADILLFDMEKDQIESTNLSAEYPEVVTSLMQELAAIIQKGRSTAGAQQSNDPLLEGVTWAQLEKLKPYLK